MSKDLFDKSSGLADQNEDAQQVTEGEDKPARSLARWSHVIAGLVFCLFYFPLDNHAWSWSVAWAVSYTTFVFAIALGLSLDYAEDFFGDPRISKYAAKLLLPHALVLTPLTFLAYLWLVAIPLLPRWVTKVHRVSLWQLCGILTMWFAGTREGVWMSAKFKLRLHKCQD